MDLKANWRAWHRRLLYVSTLAHKAVRAVRDDVREISGSFLVLGLLFREEAGESDDIGVDLLLSDWGSAVSVCVSHGWYFVVALVVSWDVGVSGSGYLKSTQYTTKVR